MAFMVVMNPTTCITCKQIVHAFIRTPDEITSFKCQDCIDKENELTSQNINSIIQEENISQLLPENQGGDLKE